MLIGTEWHYASYLRAMVKYGFRGAMDSLRIYAASLTADQVQADMANEVLVRPAVSGDFAVPMKYATFRLERFDMPLGLYNSSSSNSRTRQLAARVDGPDAVDWPAITLSIPQPDQTVKTVQPFAAGAEYRTRIMLQQSPHNMPNLQQPYDNVLQPGNHWVRGLYWRWGQTNMYTADRTARTWTWDHSLWAFPVKISGSASGQVENVVLKSEGAEIYNSGTKQLDSLTLLLPQNEAGKPYELWVNSRGPVSFDAGLQELEPDNPKDVPIDVFLELPGDGPPITVRSLNAPETFPNWSKWNEDTEALAAPKPVTPSYTPDSSSINNHVGVEVPRSPVGINFIYLPHGMSSGGFFHSEHGEIAAGYRSLGTPADYAAYVSDTGYDRVFEFGSFGANAADPASHEKVAEELAKRGVQFGFIPMTDLAYFDLQSQNLPFYTAYLPLKDTDASGVYTVTVKELLSGLTSSVQVTIAPAGRPSVQPPAALYREEALQAFTGRSGRPLAIALTAAQHGDPAIVAQANRLAAFYEAHGRSATLGLAEPGGIVRSLQEYKTYLGYPQWKTSETDLILFGNTSNNVLLLDQARGYLLPEQGPGLAEGTAAVSYANSPFVGEYDAINVIANDVFGIRAAVDAILALPPAKPAAPRLADGDPCRRLLRYAGLER